MTPLLLGEWWGEQVHDEKETGGKKKDNINVFSAIKMIIKICCQTLPATINMIITIE